MNTHGSGLFRAAIAVKLFGAATAIYARRRRPRVRAVSSPQGRVKTHVVGGPRGRSPCGEAANESDICSEQFRAKGIDCIRRATRLTDPDYKEIYYDLAIQWMAFAVEAGARNPDVPSSDHPHR
jgi:hypothetical protein